VRTKKGHQPVLSTDFSQIAGNFRKEGKKGLI